MIWLNIDGYNGEYQLSEKGDLLRDDEVKGRRIVKSCTAANGRKYVTLWKNGERKNVMLHNLYYETFHVPVRTAMQILYEGYIGQEAAKKQVRTWLLEKIQECQEEEKAGVSRHDEILYLKTFLEEINK